MKDWNLLCEFVAGDSQRAFQDLVNRHIDLVHSVALRQVQDSQLAEEVTQAVFILLARKAPRLKEETILAGWLYRTTRFVAARALRAEQRRKRREQEAFQMQPDNSSDPTWTKLEPILDDGIERLGEAERDALLLRFFEEQPFHKVGDVLGISEEAARKRVDRSLEKLRTFFSRRGFTITTAVLAVSMAKHCAQASPAALAGSIGPAAIAHAAVATSALPLLARETISAWRWSVAKAVVAGSAAVAVALLVSTHLSGMSRHSTVTPVALAGITPAKPLAVDRLNGSNTPVSASKPARNGENYFAFQAVDGVTGKPVSGAQVMAMTSEDLQQVHFQKNLVTDADGNCPISLGSTIPKAMMIGVMADSYEERCVFLGMSTPVPSAYTLKLPRGSKIGGVVMDASGNPVANASISVRFYETGDSSAREFQKERPGIPEDAPVAQTDAEGRWSFGSAPETNGDFFIEVSHPSFAKASFHTETDPHFGTTVDSLKMDDLHSGKVVLTLKSGPALSGIVLDGAGKPVPGAKVWFGEFASENNTRTETAANGSFELRNLIAGPGHVTVTANGFAPERIAVTADTNASPLEIRLQAGSLLRIQVVDTTGNPLSHISVRLQGWRGNNSMDWGGFTDDQGRIEWKSAPADELDIYAGKEGFFQSRKNLITADGQEHRIVLHKALTVTGYVIDSATKQPIANFRAIPGRDRHDLTHGTNGTYELTFEELELPLKIHFEADGYVPRDSEALDPNALGLSYGIELTKENPNEAIHGVVLLPDGTPAAGIQVALSTSEKPVAVGKGKFIYSDNSSLATTSSDGRFSFPPVPHGGTVLAINAEGFGRADVSGTNPVATVQIQPWGRIEGVLKLKKHSVAGQKLAILTSDNSSRFYTLDFNAFSTKTDDTGNFVLEQVPAGDLDVYFIPGVGLSFSHETPAKVQPGATTKIQVGGTGAMVTGRLVLSDPSLKVDWEKQVRASNLGTKSTPPPVPAGLSREARQKWMSAYWQSPEAQAKRKAAHYYPLEMASDGSFTVEDVAPGTYELDMRLFDSASDPTRPGQGKIIGSAHQDLVVPESAGDISTQTFEMEPVTVKLNPR
jgi:RNA polymerase sigma factor (sigma-70 family)